MIFLLLIWFNELKSCKRLKELNFCFPQWLKELSFFSIWLKELNFFFELDSKGWTFLLSMTQRVEPFYWVWLKESLLEKAQRYFLMTHRIEPMRKKLKELNLFFFEIWLKELNFFFNMTQRIELFSIWLKELNLLLSMTQRIELFFEYDSKNETIFLNTTQWIEPIFKYDSMNWTLFNMTRRIELFFLKKKKDSKNWNFLSMSQRIEFLSFFFEKKKKPQRIQLFSKIRYKELNFLPIWLNFFFSKYDSKNLTLHFTMTQRLFFFSKKTKTSKSSTFFMTHRLEPFCFNIFSKKKKWLKELIPFLNYDSQNVFFLKYEYDSQNWFFFNTNHRIDLFFEYDFFLTLNLFFFWIRLKELKFSDTTQRNNFFYSDMSQRIAPLFHMNYFYMTQRIEFFQYESKIFLNKSKNWTFKKKGSKNWTFFFLNMTQRIEPLSVWFKELNLFLSMTQKKIELFFFLNTTQWNDSMNRTHFFECDSNWNFWLKNIKKKIQNWFFHMTRRIEPAFFNIFKELNLFRLDSKIWCYSVWPKELNFFWLGLTELDPFLEYDAENWNFSWVFLHVYFFSQMMQRIEPFFLWIWRKELNPFFFECDVKNLIFFLNMTQRIEPFLLFDAKKRTFISLIWMTPRIVFFKEKIPNELNFLKYDSKNWTFEPCVKKQKDSENGTHLKYFLKWLIDLNPFFWTFSRWLKELKSFFNMTQRIEPFVFLKMSQRIELFLKKKMLKELNLSFIWTTF